jgi:hypothetical protein
MFRKGGSKVLPFLIKFHWKFLKWVNCERVLIKVSECKAHFEQVKLRVHLEIISTIEFSHSE